ncbi:unnamed protein product [Gongylonema pulchrum]|uniref:Uncharacterized protein n=1 Tax=Gongylonema pulchrum TaxID=637853 RepID=A0A183EKH1_9BILA|nr:unnamed protein product [Gongylonema pulchrum]
MDTSSDDESTYILPELVTYSRFEKRLGASNRIPLLTTPSVPASVVLPNGDTDLRRMNMAPSPAFTSPASSASQQPQTFRGSLLPKSEPQ